MKWIRGIWTGAALAVGLFGLVTVGHAQHGAEAGNWKHYSADNGSSRYTALSQIDANNFGDVEVLWRWNSADSELEDKTRFRPFVLRGTPLVIDGIAYMPTGLSQVAAIDVSTGETLWVHDPKSYERGMVANGMFQMRGIEYWSDGVEERIFITTGGRQLVSIDAKTGEADPEFNDGNWVDLWEGLGRKVNRRKIGHSAPPVIVGDTIVVGTIINDFPLLKKNPPGHIRGYDTRTGAMKWIFHSIPQDGEYGNETWEKDSWTYTGNTNVWSMMTADPETGYVYLPFGTPSSDYYGGHRLGDNLFAESLVCLDTKTGERVWHFQAVHHGIWDYDFPCAPNLIDITVNGKKIKAIAQVSKQGFVYVFDRLTGKPVWPIEERAVPQSNVPGERLSPTQPFPTKPPPFELQGITEDDIIDFTPELHAAGLKILEDYATGPLFSPIIVAGDGGKQALLQSPGAAGGASWPGASIDPESGFLYVQSQTRPTAMALTKPDPNRSDLDYVVKFGGANTSTLQGLPLVKPPYRRMTAYDLNKGEIAWQIPFGDGPNQHPAIKHLDLSPLGSAFPDGVLAEGGILVTKTLLITVLADVDELNGRKVNGSFLQAYDKKTGKLVGSIHVDRHIHGSPMACMSNGKQYILVAAGGISEPSELLAFGLGE